MHPDDRMTLLKKVLMWYIAAPLAVLLSLYGLGFLFARFPPSLSLLIVGIGTLSGGAASSVTRNRPRTTMMFESVLQLRRPRRSYRSRVARVLIWCAWGVILAVGLFAIIWLCRTIPQFLAWLYHSAFFKANNLLLLTFLLSLGFQVVLRPRIIKAFTWKRLSDVWLRIPSIPAISLGGLVFIKESKLVDADIIGFGVSTGYVNLHWFLFTYLIAIAVLFVGIITSRVGRTIASVDDSNIPWLAFLVAFLSSWLANVLMFGLLCDGVLLAFHYFGTKTGI